MSLFNLTCKNYWIFDLYYGQFCVSHLLPKKQQTPNKKFGQQQTNVSKTFIQEKIDANIVIERGNRIMQKIKNKNKKPHAHTSEQPKFKIVAFGSFSNILKRLNILKTKNIDQIGSCS